MSCRFMTPGFIMNIWCHVWPNFFSLLANHKSRHEAVNLVVVHGHVNLPQGFALERTDYHTNLSPMRGYITEKQFDLRVKYNFHPFLSS